MGIGDTLGIIFAAILILIAIAVAVWFYVYRRPAGVGATCSNDNDCLQPGKNPSERYQGEVCVKGVCKNVACSSNATCNAKLGGTTCFGSGPPPSPGQTREAGCIPLSCRSTNDCNPGKSEKDIATGTKGIAICVGANEPGAICVPAQTSDGKCFSLLTDEGGGKCSVCVGGQGQCPAGTYCTNGRCLECGKTQESKDLCSAKKSEDATAEAAPYGFCKMGEPCASVGIQFTCTNMVGGETITTLPDESSLNSDVGICLPSSFPDGPPCAFSWFNPTASPTGLGLGAGYCPSTAPYCTPQGCATTPIGAVCGKIAGVPSNGQAGTQGNAGSYDITGLCSGILVPDKSYANIAQFNTKGQFQGGGSASTCQVGSANPATKDCECKPGDDSTCPLGTFCQQISEGENRSKQGICTISGTGTAGPLGLFYPNTACITGQGGIPVCTTLGDKTFAGGPGDFCYVTSQCLYNGTQQNNPLRALECMNNQCVGLGRG